MLNQTMLMSKAVECVKELAAGRPLPVCSDNELEVLASQFKARVEFARPMTVKTGRRVDVWMSPADCKMALAAIHQRMNERAGM